MPSCRTAPWSGRLNTAKALPICNRRYGRLAICATLNRYPLGGERVPPGRVRGILHIQKFLRGYITVTGLVFSVLVNWIRPETARAANCPAPTFVASSTNRAGSNPVFVTTGDLNGDGKLDLAVANQSSGDVSVLLGHGDGTFDAATNYVVGTFPQSVAMGDFNRDGKLDLAVADASDPGSVYVLLGNRDGTFQEAVNYATRPDPSSVAVADLNGDGKLDLVTANYVTDGTVSVLLGNGDGSFQAAVNYAAGSNPISVAVADLSGDSA